jgi:hypothetical protein
VRENDKTDVPTTFIIYYVVLVLGDNFNKTDQEMEK